MSNVYRPSGISRSMSLNSDTLKGITMDLMMDNILRYKLRSLTRKTLLWLRLRKLVKRW